MFRQLHLHRHKVLVLGMVIYSANTHISAWIWCRFTYARFAYESFRLLVQYRIAYAALPVQQAKRPVGETRRRRNGTTPSACEAKAKPCKTVNWRLVQPPRSLTVPLILQLSVKAEHSVHTCTYLECLYTCHACLPYPLSCVCDRPTVGCQGTVWATSCPNQPYQDIEAVASTGNMDCW